MITKDGFRYWVQNKEGVPFPVHKVEEKTEGSKTTITCYLEIEPGIAYSICSRALGDCPRDTKILFYADSGWIRTKIWKSDSRPNSIISAKDADPPSTSRPLLFSTLETTDDEDDCSADQSYLLKLGEIECKVYGGRRGDPEPRKFKALKDQGKVHENSKKGVLVGAKTQYGEAFTQKNANMIIPFKIDTTLPSCHIIFKYRTRQALILLKVLDSSSIEEKEVKDEKPVIKAEEGKGEGSSTRGGKRKSEAPEPKNVINLIDDDEDVKPFKKVRPSDAGGSKETAIDLS